MKKKINVPQLNNNSIIKLLAFFALVVLLEVVAEITIFAQFSNKTYRQEYQAYNNKALSLVTVLGQTHGNDVLNNLNEEEARQAIISTCKRYGGFDEYAVFVYFDNSNDGKILYSTTDGIAVGSKLSEVGVVSDEVKTATLGDKTYVFAPVGVGDFGYGIMCASDFTASQANINSLTGNVIAILVVCGVLVGAVFLGYAYALVNRDRITLFRYKISLTKVGKVVSKNPAFKRDFPAVGQIKSPEVLENSDFTLISLPASKGDDTLLAVRSVSRINGVKVYGGKVSNADAFIRSGGESSSAGMSTAALANVFETFISKGKRTLLGVLHISNLEQIKTLFGKQMAIDIQRIILKKAKEKFAYAFELDFGIIGVTYPDGKKLDILMTDLNDVFQYINEPLKMDDNLFTLEMKGGFAMCDQTMSPLNFERAFKAAEAARQRATDTRVAEYLVYHESQKKLYAQYLVTLDIKQMLSEDAFEMEYQPQYNVNEERIEGFEALFRVKKSWNVSIDTFAFITYAERTGAMVQLGDFIFDTGMRFAKSIEGKNISVSLNVSPVQLMQAGFIDNFLRIYRKYDLKPGAICVEITESFLMTNFNETLRKLNILTQKGINVHLDDFGTEYSSLLYIKKLPISTIKIDKEFVKDVLVSKESQAIIKFITSIAKLLNGTTICEGVETCKEYDMLKYLGCDTIQGWLISKSLKPDDAAKFIETFDYKQVVARQNEAKN